jgi:hypothetical protein
MEIHSRFLEEQKFSHKATFNISGKTDQNIYILRAKNPQKDFKHERDSPKINICCTFWKLHMPIWIAPSQFYLSLDELRRKQLCSTLRYLVTSARRCRKII